MDSQIKTGKAFLQPHRAGKRWKPVLLSLFPESSSGVGRLEIQDMGGGGAGGDHHGVGVRRHHQPHLDRKLKVVRLSELVSVLRLPPNAEACPMENMSAFCMETPDRTMVFAALKDDCVDWVEKLCHSTFKRGGGSASNQLHMEENQIYSSADEASEFWVVVQRTEAATRCGLQGSYWLLVGQEALLLRETQNKNNVRSWPYELLRRYGKDKLTLTIEAGRRCESGPGSFTFETRQAEKIFSLIQTTIKQKTSPLPKIPDVTSMAVILEDKLRTQDSAHAQEGLGASSESASTQPAPITLMPLPLVPTHDRPSGGHLGGQSDPVYADPADCVQSAPKPQQSTALYVDPMCVLSLTPPSSRKGVTYPPKPLDSNPSSMDRAESIYSEVFDKITPVQIKQTVTCDEPIYAEPMSKEQEASVKKEIKPDPFAHLYAQVCKTKPPSSPSSSSNIVPSCSSSPSSVTAGGITLKATDPPVDDVIYENLGII